MKPSTTPECEQLMDMIIEGLGANIFDFQKRENARVALQKLRKKRCTKAIEYIMQVSSSYPVLDTFAQQICSEARNYLKELS